MYLARVSGAPGGSDVGELVIGTSIAGAGDITGKLTPDVIAMEAGEKLGAMLLALHPGSALFISAIRSSRFWRRLVLLLLRFAPKEKTNDRPLAGRTLFPMVRAPLAARRPMALPKRNHLTMLCVIWDSLDGIRLHQGLGFRERLELR